MERVRVAPVLLVVTARPASRPAGARCPTSLALRIDRLGRADSGLLAAATAGDATLPPELLEHVLDRAEGVPLFVEELTKAVVEAGVPKPEPDGPGPTDAPASAIPATLQDSLMARLDRLGSARRVAEIGAAIGQTFSLELLAAILPWPRADLEEALGRLLGAGLIRRASEGARSGFTFKHALVRDVAYSTLLRDRRRRLHARIAAALEHGFPDTPPELVAQHHARAGATRRAVRCWARAGELSLRQSAPAEAIAQLSAGLGLLGSLPEDAERHREEIRLHLALGQALSLSKGRAAPEVGRAFGRACELGRQGGHAPETAAALLGLYGFHFHRAELNEARAAAGELLHLAEWRGEAATRAAALGLDGSIAFFLGRLGAAWSSLEAALAGGALAQPLAFAAHGVDPRQLSLTYLAWTTLVLGRPDEARARGRDAVAEAEAPPCRPDALAVALFSDAVVHQLVRDRRSVLARADRLAALAGEQEFPLWQAGATVLRGWSLADGSGSGDAVRQMRRRPRGLAGDRGRAPGPLLPGAARRGVRPRGAARGRPAPASGRALPGGADRGAVVRGGAAPPQGRAAPAPGGVATARKGRRSCARLARWPAGKAPGRGSCGPR